jgi:hypothetical protein
MCPILAAMDNKQSLIGREAELLEKIKRRANSLLESNPRMPRADALTRAVGELPATYSAYLSVRERLTLLRVPPMRFSLD